MTAARLMARVKRAFMAFSWPAGCGHTSCNEYAAAARNFPNARNDFTAAPQQ
jgi:hypothetical protein